MRDGNTNKKISFSFPELRYSLLNSIPEKFASISQIERDGIGANNSKIEPARIHFLCAVFATIAVVDVKSSSLSYVRTASRNHV